MAFSVLYIAVGGVWHYVDAEASLFVKEIYLNIKIITEHQQPIFSTFTKVLPGFEYLSHCFTETTLYNYPSHTTASGDTVKMLSLQYTLYSD